MKLIIILLTAGALQISARGISQTVTFSGKDVSLKKLFAAIENQTGYVFFYDANLLRKAKPITLSVKDALLEEVLEHSFKDQPLSWSMINKTITIIRKPTVDLQSTGMSTEQNLPIDIMGRLINENGDPVEGASVTVKGTKIATATNANGEFQLTDVDDNATLVITGTNIETFEVKVASNPGLKAGDGVAFTTKTKISKLDEVQIIAYGQTTRRLSTGNISTVKGEDIAKQPVNNPLLALQGRVPGLVVTQNTGVAGGGVTVRIQGQNSITKGNDPLYVIDGVPINSQVPSTGLGEQILGNSGSYIIANAVITGIGNPLAFLNPNDIESIDVLKDADATAIYGSRAANGAILITTKKGKAGATKIDINLQQGWGQVTRKMDMLNTRQYLDMRYEALKNSGVDINTIAATNRRYYDLKVWDTTRYTDWQKVLIGGIAKYTNVNASISGGSEKMQFLVGGTYHRETTVFPGSYSDQKASMHFSINSGSADRKFRFQFSGNYLMDNNQLPQADFTNNAILFEPIAPALYKNDGTLNWQPSPAGVSTFNINPMAAAMNRYRNKTNNLLSNLVLGYILAPGLEIKSSFGYNKMNGNEFLPRPLAAVAPESRPFVLREAQYGLKDIHSWIIEPQVNYEKKFDKSKLTLLLGSTIQQYKDNGFYVKGQGYANDNILENINAATQVFAGGQFYSEYKYNAVFGRINYQWLDKYIVNLNARRDGSSRFGASNRFHNFGSIGAGWIFSEERFMENALPFVSFGKLRLSYGTTGNDVIGDYSYMNLYGNVGVNIPYQGAAGLQPEGGANTHLQWEETRKLNLGMDLGILKDKLLLNINYTRNRSSNQLLQYSLPLLTGFRSIASNFPATVQNTSLELQLNSTNVNNKVFSWNSNFNITIPKNKLVAFPGIETSTYSTTYIVGQSLSVQKAFNYWGVDPTSGQYLALDKHGNPTSSPNYDNDRNFLVNSFPKFYGGLQNNIRFKGLQLDFLFEFKKQIGANYIFNNGVVNPGLFSRGQSNQPISVLNRWQKPGDVSTVRYFSTAELPSDYNALISNGRYTDASYIRLKNLSLSYNLSKKWMQKVHLREGRIFIQGQNLLTITNYTGLDPENQSLSSLPPLRVLIFGIQFGL